MKSCIPLKNKYQKEKKNQSVTPLSFLDHSSNWLLFWCLSVYFFPFSNFNVCVLYVNVYMYVGTHVYTHVDDWSWCWVSQSNSESTNSPASYLARGILPPSFKAGTMGRQPDSLSISMVLVYVASTFFDCWANSSASSLFIKRQLVLGRRETDWRRLESPRSGTPQSRRGLGFPDQTFWQVVESSWASVSFAFWLVLRGTETEKGLTWLL